MAVSGYGNQTAHAGQQNVKEDWHDMAIQDHLKKFGHDSEESLVSMITSAMNTMLLLHNANRRVNHNQVRHLMPMLLELVKQNSDTYATTFQARSVLYLAGLGTLIVLVGNGYAGAQIGKTVSSMVNQGKGAIEVQNAIAAMQAYQMLPQAIKGFFDVMGQQLSQDLQGKRSLQEHIIRTQEQMLQSVRENKSDAGRRSEKHLDSIKQIVDKHFQSISAMIR